MEGPTRRAEDAEIFESGMTRNNWLPNALQGNRADKKDRDNRGIDDNMCGNCGLVQHDPELLP
jgi:hypothetical protein